VIGIGAIVALVSLGEGMKYSIANQLEKIGPNKIVVMPQISFQMGGTHGFGTEELTDNDLNKIKNIRGVSIAIPIFFRTLPVKYKDEIRNLYVTGFPVKEAENFFSDVQNFEIDEGRFMNKNEKYAAVLGSLLKKDMFSEDMKIRSKIQIEGKDIKVVGFLKPIGSAQDDSSLMMSIEGLREITGSTNEITMILVKATDDPKQVSKKIEDVLDKIHGEDTFMAMTTDQIIESISKIFGIISLIFGGIAAISLLVAGFGIANTMLMSVVERTREIGTMKAIGATKGKIMRIFLTEASLVGFIGGIIGIVFGLLAYSIIAGFSYKIVGISLPAVIASPFLLIFVLCFAVFVGAVSGLYPAWYAAKLNPVEALRYE